MFIIIFIFVCFIVLLSDEVYFETKAIVVCHRRCHLAAARELRCVVVDVVDPYRHPQQLEEAQRLHGDVQTNHRVAVAGRGTGADHFAVDSARRAQLAGAVAHDEVVRPRVPAQEYKTQLVEVAGVVPPVQSGVAYQIGDQSAPWPLLQQPIFEEDRLRADATEEEGEDEGEETTQTSHPGGRSS